MSNLVELFWSIADDTASAFGFSFASDCKGNMMDMIKQGVDRLEIEGFANDNDKILSVKRNIALFVTTMVAEARRQQLPALHEPTFHAASARLCPLWPFC